MKMNLLNEAEDITLENYFSSFREQVIGNNEYFETHF